MRLTLDPRALRLLRRLPRSFPYTVVEILLLAAIAWQLARIVWTAFAPVGPLGDWRPAEARIRADAALLTGFDPFFRLDAAGGAAVVTSLALKLYGVRIDVAAGRGSAIIATPDGLQSSFAVGDEIVPGVRLKTVAIDSVTIDRGGAAEQLFLDQSKPAQVAGTAPATPPLPALDLRAATNAVPRSEGGFVVSPNGAGQAFRAAGLLPGDVVTQVDGRPARSLDEVVAAMGTNPQGGFVSLTVERSGKPVTVNVPVNSQ